MKQRDKPPTADEKLFEHCPEAVKKLRRQAVREKRLRDRREWKAKNHK